MRVSMIHRLFDNLQSTRQPFSHRHEMSKGQDRRNDPDFSGPVRLSSDLTDVEVKR